MLCYPFGQVASCLADVRYVRGASNTIKLIDDVRLQIIGDLIFVAKQTADGIIIGKNESEIYLWEKRCQKFP